MVGFVFPKRTPTILDVIPMWQIGNKILNRYEVRAIKGGPGVSGWGIVYICYDHEGRIPLAVKTFQDDYIVDAKVRDNFLKEAYTWVSLDRHRNIVKAEWVLEIEGRPYIFLEYVAGGNLEEWLGTKMLDLITALDFAAQFCNGMDYAFQKLNLVHRDIKPSNVLVSQDGTVKISDFGLAKALKEPQFQPEKQYSYGGSFPHSSIAPLLWAAPEQWTGDKIDTRADIYSFGLLLYQMITGKHAYQESSLNWPERHLYESAAPIGDPNVPDDLEELMFKCLEKSPKSRYQNFGTLRTDICQIYSALSGKDIELSLSTTQLRVWELCNKALALKNLGRYEESLEYCERVLASNPQQIDALLLKGSTFGEMGRCEESLEMCEQILNFDPMNVKALINKGVCLAKLGRFTESMECHNHALEVSPGNPEALIPKSADLAELGKFTEALDCCEEALRSRPNSVVSLINKGAVLGKMGKISESISCLDEALKIDPWSIPALINKGNSLQYLRMWDEAIKCYNTALWIEPKSKQASLGKGSCLLNLQRFREALECANEALEVDPGYGIAQRLRADCLKQLH